MFVYFPSLCILFVTRKRFCFSNFPSFLFVYVLMVPLWIRVAVISSFRTVRIHHGAKTNIQAWLLKVKWCQSQYKQLSYSY